jgi:hypothetical protein
MSLLIFKVTSTIDQPCDAKEKSSCPPQSEILKVIKPLLRDIVPVAAT